MIEAFLSDLHLESNESDDLQGFGNEVIEKVLFLVRDFGFYPIRDLRTEVDKIYLYDELR